ERERRRGQVSPRPREREALAEELLRVVVIALQERESARRDERLASQLGRRAGAPLERGAEPAAALRVMPVEIPEAPHGRGGAQDLVAAPDRELEAERRPQAVVLPL